MSGIVVYNMLATDIPDNVRSIAKSYDVVAQQTEQRCLNKWEVRSALSATAGLLVWFRDITLRYYFANVSFQPHFNICGQKKWRHDR